NEKSLVSFAENLRQTAHRASSKTGSSWGRRNQIFTHFPRDWKPRFRHPRRLAERAAVSHAVMSILQPAITATRASKRIFELPMPLLDSHTRESFYRPSFGGQLSENAA
ncbi:MAG TPA: hypothetical protein VGI40_04055, partial [Pirellulaceae bacterium]